MCTVIIDEIGDTYAKKSTIKARVETCQAFSLDDTTKSVIGRRLSSLGFDLCTGGDCDEWVSTRVFSNATSGAEKLTTYVNVMARRPPPAPARAWAILSPCCAADVA